MSWCWKPICDHRGVQIWRDTHKGERPMRCELPAQHEGPCKVYNRGTLEVPRT